MLSVGTFADEMEREKARQRTSDAMVKKARQGFVTGGKIYGYRSQTKFPRGTRDRPCAGEDRAISSPTSEGRA
jgi:DNA invertase Pin-like site-specific DNA recombinase